MKGCVVERKGKHGKVSYQLKFDVGKNPTTGKRVTRRQTVKWAKNMKDAQRALRDTLKKIDDGVYTDPSKMTFTEWALKKWLPTKATKATKTFQRYAEILNLHVIPQLGHLPLQKLTSESLDSFYARLRVDGSRRKIKELETKRGLSEQSILHIHRCVSLCLKEAVRKGKISRNPAQEACAPTPKMAEEHEGEDIRALNPDELNKLLVGFRGEEDFDFVALASATGARRSELCALSYDKIDFENKTIAIVRSVEDANTESVVIKSTKNKASKRKIGIDDNIVRILRERKLRYAEDLLKLGVRLPSDAFVFPKSILEVNTPKRPRAITSSFIRRAKKLGFAGLKLHDLRHTHATLLLEAGVPVHAVAQRLGHSTPNQTLATYSHVLKRSEDKAVDVTRDLLKEVLGKI